MMFDSKKVGEEADQMIHALNRPAGVPEKEPATDEDQGATAVEAIAEEVTQDDSADDTTPPAPEQTDELGLLKKQLEKADQRWRVLQGMIDRKDTELDNMRAIIAQLNRGSESKTETSDHPVDLITPDDRKAFGDDLISLIGRKATEVVRGAVEDAVSRMDRRVAELEGKLNGVAQVATTTRQETFADALTREVPDWQTVNQDPAFIEWAQVIDPATGRTRQDLLQLAYADGSVARTAYFFKAFKAESAPAPAPRAAQNPAKFASPGKSKATSQRPQQEPEERMWSRADIAKLYDDKRMNRIKQSEFDALEADLFKAQAEGRLVG